MLKADHSAPANQLSAEFATIVAKIAATATHETDSGRILASVLEHLSLVLPITAASLIAVEHGQLVVEATSGSTPTRVLGQVIDRA